MTNEILREKRSLPPADYSLRVESFSLLSNSTVDKFESGVFKSGGYNWRLVFYPKGNQRSDGRDHLSLYLKIDDSNPHPAGTWNVNVYFKLFVFDQTSNQYLVVQDAKAPMRRFDRLKSEWGFGKFLDLATFNEPSNGYLVDDTCAFGAEVYVVKPTGSEEILSMVTEPAGGTFSWTIPSFGGVGNTVQYSDEFTVGERNWQLVVYPAGSGNDKGSYLTVSLKLADYQRVSPKKPVYAEFKLKVPNQYSRNRAGVEHTIKHFFNSPAEIASSKFLTLDELYDNTKGYLSRNEALIVEVQFLVVSMIKANT